MFVWLCITRSGLNADSQELNLFTDLFSENNMPYYHKFNIFSTGVAHT